MVKDNSALEWLQTGDGSSTLRVPEMDETYHSQHGAVQEALHVFVENGFVACAECLDPVRILEVGFGTGLNAWLTMHRAEILQKRVVYHSIEKFPLRDEWVEKMHFPVSYNTAPYPPLDALHSPQALEERMITHHFRFRLIPMDVKQFEAAQPYDLVYFDAFGPRAQPSMWEVPVFERMYRALKPDGRLVTYCAQGQFRRNLKAAGFHWERLDGPPGKREMTLAVKPL
ncbi:MAG: SAM-dependent methyltransferase [Cryomorphaceae bacterium]|nr:MAG: SAM-dependent methyltransferase [Cryomorphaceae bacterium]